jgi:hypothetical protein
MGEGGITMQIICRGRRGGKTVEAIRLAAKTWSYIVCINRKEADRVFDVAQKLGIDIPNPITIEDLIGKRYCAKGIRGFIIDNADKCLQSLTPVPIKAITVTEGWDVLWESVKKAIKAKTRGEWSKLETNWRESGDFLETNWRETLKNPLKRG